MKKHTNWDDLPLVLSAEDVAQVLGVSRSGAYILLHSRGFPTVKIGKRLLVPRDALRKWIEDQTQK